MSGKEIADLAERLVVVWPQAQWTAARKEEYRRSLRRLADRHGLTAEQVSKGVDRAVDDHADRYPPTPAELAGYIRQANGLSAGANGRSTPPLFEPAGPNTWRVRQPGGGR